MEKYGIIGFPLIHSFSPLIHNPAFKRLNINAHYAKIEISPDIFDPEILKLKQMNYSGFNITVPYKQKILKYLDNIDPMANKIGAVNTIASNNGYWKGYNTDIYGFIKPLKKYLPQIKNILVIGAGGASYAVCFALVDKISPEKFVIINRTKSKAQALCNKLTNEQKIEIEYYDLLEFAEQKNTFDLIINTTIVGMGVLQNKKPVDLIHISHEDSLVYDLIYNPKKTLLLKQASQLNLNAINGIPMLFGQAMKSFKIWTGIDYPEEILKEDLF